MVWLGERRGHLVDWVTQRWVQITGRRVALADVPWLVGPSGSVHGIGADFFAQWGERNGLRVLPPSRDDGLVDGMVALAGPRFDPSAVHTRIDDFYAHTAAYDLRIDRRQLVLPVRDNHSCRSSAQFIGCSPSSLVG